MSGKSSIEIVVHPDSNVKPLVLEELITSLYSIGDSVSFEITYFDKYVRIYFVGPKGVLDGLRKSLMPIYGRVIVEDGHPPSLAEVLKGYGYIEERGGKVRVVKGCSWFVAELRLRRPFYYPLIPVSYTHLTLPTN